MGNKSCQLQRLPRQQSGVAVVSLILLVSGLFGILLGTAAVQRQTRTQSRAQETVLRGSLTVRAFVEGSNCGQTGYESVDTWLTATNKVGAASVIFTPFERDADGNPIVISRPLTSSGAVSFQNILYDPSAPDKYASTAELVYQPPAGVNIGGQEIGITPCPGSSLTRTITADQFRANQNLYVELHFRKTGYITPTPTPTLTPTPTPTTTTTPTLTPTPTPTPAAAEPQQCPALPADSLPSCKQPDLLQISLRPVAIDITGFPNSITLSWHRASGPVEYRLGVWYFITEGNAETRGVLAGLPALRVDQVDADIKKIIHKIGSEKLIGLSAVEDALKAGKQVELAGFVQAAFHLDRRDEASGDCNCISATSESPRLVLAPTGTTPTPAPTGSAWMKGRVVFGPAFGDIDGSGQHPVDGARVTIQGQVSAPAGYTSYKFTTTTDEQGYFNTKDKSGGRFVPCAPGTHCYRIEAQDPQSGVTDGGVGAGDLTRAGENIRNFVITVPGEGGSCSPPGKVYYDCNECGPGRAMKRECQLQGFWGEGVCVDRESCPGGASGGGASPTPPPAPSVSVAPSAVPSLGFACPEGQVCVLREYCGSPHEVRCSGDSSTVCCEAAAVVTPQPVSPSATPIPSEVPPPTEPTEPTEVPPPDETGLDVDLTIVNKYALELGDQTIVAPIDQVKLFTCADTACTVLYSPNILSPLMGGDELPITQRFSIPAATTGLKVQVHIIDEYEGIKLPFGGNFACEVAAGPGKSVHGEAVFESIADPNGSATIYGRLNCDGLSSDYIVEAAGADLDCNGLVNSLDMSLALRNYRRSLTTSCQGKVLVNIRTYNEIEASLRSLAK